MTKERYVTIQPTAFCAFIGDEHSGVASFLCLIMCHVSKTKLIIIQ